MNSLETTSKERVILERLSELLRTIVGVELVQKLSFPAADAIFDVIFEGKNLRLAVECKTSVVYPRDARELGWKTLRHFGAGGDVIAMVAAEMMSSGAQEEFRRAGISYFDMAGNLFLRGPGLYVQIEKPPTKKQERVVRSVFTARRAPVLHALIERRDEWVNAKALAEQTGVSHATVGQVLRELEKRELLQERGAGPAKERMLVEAGDLLDEWVKASKPRSPDRRYYVPHPKGNMLLESLAQAFEAAGIQYAVSWEAAAQSYSPHLTMITTVGCRVLNLDAADTVVRDALNGRVVSEGSNLFLYRSAPSEIRAQRRVENVNLATPVQVYLDLVNAPGRAKELAAQLRRQELKL